MKNTILKILKEIQKRKEFQNCQYSLTVNYEKVITHFLKNHELCYHYLNDKTEELVLEKINDVDIKNFNFTFTLEANHEEMMIAANNEEYWDGFWKRSDFVFHGDEKEKMYILSSLGSGNRDFNLSNFLTIPISNFDNNWATKKLNNFNINNIEQTINLLLELDDLLDKQYSEKQNIINKLKNLK